MTSTIFDAYVKAYEVALFGREKTRRGHRETHREELQAAGSGSDLRRSAGRTLFGMVRSRRS